MDHQQRAEEREEYSPAEALLSLTSGEVLRLSFCKNVNSGCLQSIELYIWICPKTDFFRGIKFVNKSQVLALSELPLSCRELLSKINATSFQPGSDLIERLHDINVNDLQRLYYLNLKAA